MAIYILAHELRHVWQWRVLGGISERDACAYGIHILRRWRRSGVGHPTDPLRQTEETRRAAYLLAENLRRRQLSVGQKAMIGGKVANVPAPRPPIGAASREKILAHWRKFDTE